MVTGPIRPLSGSEFTIRPTGAVVFSSTVETAGMPSGVSPSMTLIVGASFTSVTVTMTAVPSEVLVPSEAVTIRVMVPSMVAS